MRTSKSVSRRRRTLAVTAGDPCGVGPEVLLKALATLPSRGRPACAVIGDLNVFRLTAQRLHLRLPRWTVLNPVQARRELPTGVSFVDLGQRRTWIPGRTSAAAGSAAVSYLDCAVSLWRAGRILGLVTAPVTKWSIARTRPAFVGQTEYLSAAMGRANVAMMFIAPQLRVVLLTRHLPLRQVPQAVDQRLIDRTITLTRQTLREHFRIRTPRLAVCGLNPHAGEGGLFGSEEQRCLQPALRRLRRRGMRLDGPLAADGLFPIAHRYDAVVCWYHDQALIPFKLLARDRGCQLSAGLPIVRTSPNHGSALDIAGRGVAHPGSMRYALELAAKLMQDPSPVVRRTSHVGRRRTTSC